jgi:hypothetical protein
MVNGKAKRFSVEQKAMPVGAGGLAPPFYIPVNVGEHQNFIHTQL